MAHSKKNYYLRILQIQRIWAHFNQKGVTNVFIYNNYIYPIYFVSMPSFYNYLNINAAVELRKLKVEPDSVPEPEIIKS